MEIFLRIGLCHVHSDEVEQKKWRGHADVWRKAYRDSHPNSSSAWLNDVLEFSWNVTGYVFEPATIPNKLNELMREVKDCQFTPQHIELYATEFLSDKRHGKETAIEVKTETPLGAISFRSISEAKMTWLRLTLGLTSEDLMPFGLLAAQFVNALKVKKLLKEANQLYRNRQNPEADAAGLTKLIVVESLETHMFKVSLLSLKNLRASRPGDSHG